MQLMGWVWLFAAGAGWVLMRRAKIYRPLGRFLKVAAAFAALPLSAVASWARVTTHLMRRTYGALPSPDRAAAAPHGSCCP